MFGNKVKIPDDLMAKIKKYAEAAGYASAEEFIIHALEKEVTQLDEAESEDDIKKKLKGLGYIS